MVSVDPEFRTDVDDVAGLMCLFLTGIGKFKMSDGRG